MRYDKNKTWIEMVLRNADVMNTLNGGTSQAKVGVEKKEDHYLIRAAAPGVNPDTFQVEVVDQHILIYHTVKFVSKEGDEVGVPRVLTSFPISLAMDYENITAEMENDQLNVKIPLNENFRGYNRNITINKG